MKIKNLSLPCVVLVFTIIASSPARAVWIEQEIPMNAVMVTASIEYSPAQTARHLIDGSGMRNGVHDNEGSAQTMWHTTERPAPTSAAADLPASPAWVRFDFKEPQKFNSIHIWNDNQANRTERGFRRTRIFGSVDGVSWFTLTTPEVVELPRASGSPGLDAFVTATTAEDRALKSVVIAAESKDGNYGSDYYGLSSVRFVVGHEVAEADLPVPTNLACAALPYCPYRPDGKPGRQIAVSLMGMKLYGPVTFDVECNGAKEETCLLYTSPSP